MSRKYIFEKTYNIDFSAEPKPRNVIILLDGTWNDETGKGGDGIVTNVYKLYQLLDDDSPHQIKRYFRGVGNDEDNTLWDRLTQGAFGSGEQKIREHAYSTICKDYHPGDRIFIFGFSRGAACARMLASMLNKEGIPEKITITTRPTPNKQSRNIEYEFVSFEPSGNRQNVHIEFLGVWDTVFAFGIPVKLLGIPFHKYNLFKDRHVSSNVKYAVHLVGIDETRDPFIPVLMNHNPERIHEVWFPGVHADVGGGYEEDEIGRITLNYMLKKLDQHCEVNGIQSIRYNADEKLKLTKPGDKKVVFHYHGLGWKKSFRDIHILKNDEPELSIKPLVHESLLKIRTDPNVYSKQTKKFLFFWKSKPKFFRMVYNPPGIRWLKQKFTIVN